ncbi:MAG: type III-B CRISPR module RAMP protein Cmr1 [Chloroflexota bacterium]|nr:type III-B CRISPR module RAMP protein Cmr1 [Chloroflexota bacterium]
MKITLRMQTPLWTGGVDGKSTRLHETGLIGSIRWWYEVIVRGLGGSACDPTGDRSCPDKEGKRCAACQLFGCTSWQRKFKLRILDEDDNLFTEKPDAEYGFPAKTSMTWHFLELRPLEEEERWLLMQAINIASKYGAIGGRTTLKPQGNKRVGGDYGLFEITNRVGEVKLAASRVRSWLNHDRFRKVPNHGWPDLRGFFFVSGQCLWRKQINALLGLSADGDPVNHGKLEVALRGQVGVSKKVFSFDTPSARRLWGYVPTPQLRKQAIQRLQELGIEASNIRTGEEVLDEL